ncbi:MAG: dienelactone hydrolase family protein [Cyanobacteria bacterium J069]
MSLRAISIPPRHGSDPEALLVMLHGWGANAQDVASLALMLDLPTLQLLFPDAPFPYPYGPTGRVWYDLPDNYAFESDPEFVASQPKLQESAAKLTEWLRSLPAITGVPLEKTLLGGFSQGGAMALEVGLSLPLAGLLVLSGYLHGPPRLGTVLPPPVLMVHGQQDLVVPIEASWRSRDVLQSAGLSVRYHELPTGHEITPAVLKLAQNFTEEIRLSASRSE